MFKSVSVRKIADLTKKLPATRAAFKLINFFVNSTRSCARSWEIVRENSTEFV